MKKFMGAGLLSLAMMLGLLLVPEGEASAYWEPYEINSDWQRCSAYYDPDQDGDIIQETYRWIYSGGTCYTVPHVNSATLTPYIQYQLKATAGHGLEDYYLIYLEEWNSVEWDTVAHTDAWVNDQSASTYTLGRFEEKYKNSNGVRPELDPNKYYRLRFSNTNVRDDSYTTATNFWLRSEYNK